MQSRVARHVPRHVARHVPCHVAVARHVVVAEKPSPRLLLTPWFSSP